MTTYTSSTGKSGITEMVFYGYSCEMTIPNTARDRNKEFQVVLKDCLKMKKRIAELEQNTNKAKAASVRDSISYIEANFEYGRSDLYALLMQYAEKIEKGKL